jgi:hypothetical protein
MEIAIEIARNGLTHRQVLRRFRLGIMLSMLVTATLAAEKAQRKFDTEIADARAAGARTLVDETLERRAERPEMV